MEQSINSYRVVVVDDESLAVEAICQILKEYCPSFQVVGTAGNGIRALEVIRETAPDLVLADIEMPQMSGLELIHRANAYEKNLCFVIISGYQDFEYAQDAIRSGVLDYLTKPIVPSKIVATMKNVEEKLQTFYYEKRNQIFRRLCMGETVVLEELRRFFPHREYYAALLRENGLPRRYSSAKELELYGTMQESFSVYGRDNMEELFLIPCEVLGEQSIIDYMTKINLRQKTEGSYTTLLYYAEPFSRTEISEKVRDLYYWLNTLSTVGYSQVVDLDQTQELQKRLPMTDHTEIQRILSEMEQYARLNKSQQMQRCISQIFVQWETERRSQLWVEQTVRRMINFIRTQTGDEASLVESEYQFEDAFYYSTDMQMLCQNLSSFFAGLPEKERENPKVDSKEFFEKIEQYLKEHLSEPLSLQEISELFAISQTYMSKLFRKYSGQSYHQYLTAVRMERAKYLMETNGELYIREIAEMVGYRDQFYFSRIFHSYYQKSPSEYLR